MPCRRSLILITVVAASATLVAGCGGGSSSRGVAHLSTSMSAGSAADGGGTSSTPESSASTQQKIVAYSQCMRCHGVPNVPDPTSGAGNRDKPAVVGALRRVGNSQAEAAQTACLYLQPNRGEPTRPNVRSTSADLLAFARCMRTRGITNFPDPTSSGQVTHEMLASAGMDEISRRGCRPPTLAAALPTGPSRRPPWPASPKDIRSWPRSETKTKQPTA